MEKLLARLPPVVGASLSTAFGGTAAIATRFAIGESDAIALAFLRHVGCGLLVAGLAWAALGRRFRIARGDLLPITVLALLQFAVYGWLFTASLAYAPAARAALVMTLMPLATLLLAAAVGRERLTAAKVVACALATAGVAIALGDGAGAGGDDEVWKGDALMAGAVLIGAIYATASGPYLRRNPSLAVAAYSILIGAAALLGALALRGNFSGLSGFSTGGWLAVLWLAGPAGVLPFYLWLWAFERTTPARVTITIALNPITAGIFGALLLGEPVTLRLLAGLVLIVAGIALAYRPLGVLRAAKAG